MILAGDGRVKIDHDVRALHGRDAIRFAPNTTRAFEAGPAGLEFLVFGPITPETSSWTRTSGPRRTNR